MGHGKFGVQKMFGFLQANLVICVSTTARMCNSTMVNLDSEIHVSTNSAKSKIAVPTIATTYI